MPNLAAHISIPIEIVFIWWLFSNCKATSQITYNLLEGHGNYRIEERDINNARTLSWWKYEMKYMKKTRQKYIRETAEKYKNAGYPSKWRLQRIWNENW